MFFNNFAFVKFGKRDKPFTGFRILEVTSSGHTVALTGRYKTFVAARNAYDLHLGKFNYIVIEEENGVRVGEWKILP